MIPVNYEPIEPRIILDAFSARKIFVSMMDGPPTPFDSKGAEYTTLRADTVERFLDQLVEAAGAYENVVVEWRVWPEYEAQDRLYGRFTIRPISTLN